MFFWSSLQYGVCHANPGCQPIIRPTGQVSCGAGTTCLHRLTRWHHGTCIACGVWSQQPLTLSDSSTSATAPSYITREWLHPQFRSTGPTSHPSIPRTYQYSTRHIETTGITRSEQRARVRPPHMTQRVRALKTTNRQESHQQLWDKSSIRSHGRHIFLLRDQSAASKPRLSADWTGDTKGWEESSSLMMLSLSSCKICFPLCGWLFFTFNFMYINIYKQGSYI